MAFQDYIKIPNNNEVFTIGNDEVDILQKGVYEITFCGQITGGDQGHGAIFYLTGKSGTTNRMDCSETIITEFENPTTLLVRCGIIGDSSTANIDFANVNLIIKKYNV